MPDQTCAERPRTRRMIAPGSLLSLACLVGVNACGYIRLQAQQGKAPASAPVLIPRPETTSKVRIGAGDLVDVQVFNTPELSVSKLRVSDDGRVRLPVTGDFHIAGLTAGEAGAAIEGRLRDTQMMLDPHVEVLITEYATQGVRVLGEVKTPGTYVLLGPHSLYDALSAAGGVTPNEGDAITVTHQSDPLHPEEVAINSANYSETERMTQIEAGDVIVVAKASAIYVVGDVAHPGEYMIPHGDPLTVLNAVALAQGTNPTAAVSKASIVRKTSTGAVTIAVNIRKIEQNTAPNPVLKADDVLVIPRSGAREFLTYALPNATSAVVASVSTALVVR